MNDKIIELFKHEDPPGKRILNQLSDEDATELITFLYRYAIKEVEIGLGLVELDGDPELKVFHMIDEVYDRAKPDCYFCDDRVDPNEEQIGPKTKICPMCKLKLGNFVQSLGLDPTIMFEGMPPRTHQKARIKR